MVDPPSPRRSTQSLVGIKECLTIYQKLPPKGLAVEIVAFAGTVVVSAGPVEPKNDPAMVVVVAPAPKSPPPKALVVAPPPKRDPVEARPPAAVGAKLKGFAAAVAVLPKRPPAG